MSQLSQAIPFLFVFLCTSHSIKTTFDINTFYAYGRDLVRDTLLYSGLMTLWDPNLRCPPTGFQLTGFLFKLELQYLVGILYTMITYCTLWNAPVASGILGSTCCESARPATRFRTPLVAGIWTLMWVHFLLLFPFVEMNSGIQLMPFVLLHTSPRCDTVPPQLQTSTTRALFTLNQNLHILTEDTTTGMSPENAHRMSTTFTLCAHTLTGVVPRWEPLLCLLDQNIWFV